jgi:hypothetical protein
MAQMNLHMAPALENALSKFMRLRGIRTKSEAVRIALQEGLERALMECPSADFRTWIGLAKQAPLNDAPRFHDHDELWR